MNKKLLLWIVVSVALAVAALALVRHHYVLSSIELEQAINRELPTGLSKGTVLKFVQRRQLLFWDDLGSQVKARLSGRAENMIYGKDIVLTSEFDSDGKLKSYSKKEYLTFF